MAQFTRLLTGVAVVTLVAAVTPTRAHAQNIFSGVGGVCLNAEGGVRDGARIIGWFCSGASNEQFYIENGAIKLSGTTYCIASDGRAQGAQLRLRTCNGDPSTQNFAYWSGNRIGHNTGYCMDLSGAGWFGQANGGGKPVILWTCHGGTNQLWFAGRAAPQSSIAVSGLRIGDRVVVAGSAGVGRWDGSRLIGNDGSTMVAAGGGNVAVVNKQLMVVGGKGGNLVAAGGGN